MTFSISQTQVDAGSREAQHICQKCTYFSDVDIFLISGQLVTLSSQVHSKSSEVGGAARESSEEGTEHSLPVAVCLCGYST